MTLTLRVSFQSRLQFTWTHDDTALDAIAITKQLSLQHYYYARRSRRADLQAQQKRSWSAVKGAKPSMKIKSLLKSSHSFQQNMTDVQKAADNNE